MIADYKKLYYDTLKPLVNSLDASRPYLLSSPSNGVETEKQGGYSENPGDTAYGDIHFYTDFDNLWKDSTYKTPRCATEYGIQSYPLRDTMTAWINQSEWTYGSKSMNLRQHHTGGAINNLVLVYQHFELPIACGVTKSSELLTCEQFTNSAVYMDDFSLLSQVHQAVAMQVESEHYRR
uniref:Uncharacterized protein n=1 Tax=Ditylenchus dipsaci TaxID=166011 RepID=A0A915EJM3_9BILA